MFIKVIITVSMIISCSWSLPGHIKKKSQAKPQRLYPDDLVLYHLTSQRTYYANSPPEPERSNDIKRNDPVIQYAPLQQNNKDGTFLSEKHQATVKDDISNLEPYSSRKGLLEPRNAPERHINTAVIRPVILGHNLELFEVVSRSPIYNNAHQSKPENSDNKHGKFSGNTVLSSSTKIYRRKEVATTTGRNQKQTFSRQLDNLAENPKIYSVQNEDPALEESILLPHPMSHRKHLNVARFLAPITLTPESNHKILNNPNAVIKRTELGHIESPNKRTFLFPIKGKPKYHLL